MRALDKEIIINNLLINEKQKYLENERFFSLVYKLIMKKWEKVFFIEVLIVSGI